MSEIGAIAPGRVLEIACGTGANAVWLAQQGWLVTALDFSEAAIKRAKALAANQSVDIEFLVGDATSYKPEGIYDLIFSFYIQLFPEQRAKMLANAIDALGPQGTLLFVSHDRSGPPPGWEEEFITTLTTPAEVVAELQGLEIQKAYVFSHMLGSPHGTNPGKIDKLTNEPQEWLSTVVRATKNTPK